MNIQNHSIPATHYSQAVSSNSKESRLNFSQPSYASTLSQSLHQSTSTRKDSLCDPNMESTDSDCGMKMSYLSEGDENQIESNQTFGSSANSFMRDRGYSINDSLNKNETPFIHAPKPIKAAPINAMSLPQMFSRLNPSALTYMYLSTLASQGSAEMLLNSFITGNKQNINNNSNVGQGFEEHSINRERLGSASLNSGSSYSQSLDNDPEASYTSASQFYGGKLSRTQRMEKVKKYLLKKANRRFAKNVRYECRKSLADKRVRFQGRFVKVEQLEALNAMLEQSKISDGRKQIFKTEIDTSIREQLWGKSNFEEQKGLDDIADQAMSRGNLMIEEEGEEDTEELMNGRSNMDDKDIEMGDPSFQY